MVELTDQERKEATDAAIQQAKARKHNSLESERKQRLAIARRNDILRQWTPAELYELAKWRATQIIRSRTGDPAIEFSPTANQKPITTALSLYFTNSPEFEQLNPKDYNSNKLPFSLNKGIWLWGNPGVGKTLLMEIFSRNKRLCYDVKECPKICYSYVKYGDEILNHFINIRETAAPDASTFFQKTIGVCYNDLGTENINSVHYGNPLNVMEYIFLQTYERGVPYHHRHVTTNVTMEQVKQTYTVRVLDRIKECFNVMELKGESLRK